MNEARLRQEFRDRVTVSGYGICVMASAHEACWLRLEAHHVIKRQTVRAKLLHLPEADRLRAEWDARNGIPVCRFHHEQLTRKGRFLDRLQIPEVGDLIVFAEQYGLTPALEREVPSLIGGTIR